MKAAWPIGLRMVFCVVVLAFVVSTGQVAYYGLMGQGVFPDEIGGKWALVSYVVQAINIVLGLCRLRRWFAVGVTALCLYSIPLTAFHTWPMIQYFWQDVLSGRMTFAGMLTWDMWCLVWNNVCLSVDTCVLLYLLSYEFRLFGPGKVERHRASRKA